MAFEQHGTRKKSDRIASFISNTLGSITFLFVCLCFFSLWITWNLNLLPHLKPFDPFPFPELEMVVSIFAIILSVAVLISQKRQGKMEKIRQNVEFEVNIRAEMEITKMLDMLHQIQKHLGIHSTTDHELEEMKKSIDIEELHQHIQDNDQA